MPTLTLLLDAIAFEAIFAFGQHAASVTSWCWWLSLCFPGVFTLNHAYLKTRSCKQLRLPYTPDPWKLIGATYSVDVKAPTELRQYLSNIVLFVIKDL